MAVMNLQAFAEALAPDARILALDLGSKTIGVAVSDGRRRVASPVETIRRRAFSADAARLRTLMTERAVGGMVIGLPRNMDGSEGPRCQATRAFAANFLDRHDLPLTFWDERLSTAAVEKFLVDEADLSRRRRSEVVDALAASYILQGFLDRLAAEPRP